MKIRAGFVANSSSTSYTVFLPDWFYLKDEDIEYEFNNKEHESYKDDTSPGDFSKSMKDLFRELIKEKDIRQDDTHGLDYNSLINIFQKYNLIISTLDVESSCGGIFVITQKDIDKSYSKCQKELFPSEGYILQKLNEVNSA